MPPLHASVIVLRRIFVVPLTLLDERKIVLTARRVSPVPKLRIANTFDRRKVGRNGYELRWDKHVQEIVHSSRFVCALDIMIETCKDSKRVYILYSSVLVVLFVATQSESTTADRIDIGAARFNFDKPLCYMLAGALLVGT